MRLFLGLSVRLVRLDAGAGGAELAGPVVVADVDFFFTESLHRTAISPAGSRPRHTRLSQAGGSLKLAPVRSPPHFVTTPQSSLMNDTWQRDPRVARLGPRRDPAVLTGRERSDGHSAGVEIFQHP